MTNKELKQRLIELLNIVPCKECCSASHDGRCIDLDDLNICQHIAIVDRLIENGVTIRERGKWTFACVHNGKKFYKCSNCWHAFPSVDKESCEETCPHCGADMRGEKDE